MTEAAPPPHRSQSLSRPISSQQDRPANSSLTPSLDPQTRCLPLTPLHVNCPPMPAFLPGPHHTPDSHIRRSPCGRGLSSLVHTETSPFPRSIPATELGATASATLRPLCIVPSPSLFSFFACGGDTVPAFVPCRRPASTIRSLLLSRCARGRCWPSSHLRFTHVGCLCSPPP